MSRLNNDKISVELDLRAQKAQEEIHRLNNATKELRLQNQAYRKEKAALERVEGDHTAEFKRLNEAIDANTRKIDANKRAMETERQKIDISRMSAAQLGKELKNLKRELNNTSKATNPKRYRDLEDQIRRTDKALAEAQRSTRGFLASLLSLDKTKATIIGFFTAIGMVVLNTVVGAFRDAFNLVVEFEKANARLASVLGTTVGGIKELTTAARQLGATTSYTAAEVTSLQIELAKLGFGKRQILDMEAGVLKFAKAVDTDLARAAAFAGAALRIFGKDASDTDEVLASFAIATTKTALDFSKLESSLATVGPVAHAFGLTLEDTTALIGLLANAGFDASSAATASRNIILKLCDANGDLAKALGTPVHSAADLANGLRKLNDEGVDLAKALELTDKRSVAAFSTFLSSADQMVPLRNSITGVTADFNDMALTMGDNVAGAMAGLQSAAQELVLKISQGTNGPIKDLIKALTWLVTETGTVITYISKFSTALKITAAALATYKIAVLTANSALRLWAASSKAMNTLLTIGRAAITSYSARLAAMRGALNAATASTTAMRTALASIKWVSVIGAVAAVTAAIIAFCASAKKSTAVIDAINAAEEETAKGIDQTKAKLTSLISVAKDENIALDTRKKAIDELNRIVPNYNAQIDETTGKYKASNKALTTYLGNLEKELRYKANKSKLEDLTAKAEDLRRKKEKADEEAKKEERNSTYTSGNVNYSTSSGAGGGYAQMGYFHYNYAARNYAAKVSESYIQAENDVQELISFINKGLSEGTMVLKTQIETVDDLDDNFDGVNDTTNKTVTRLKEINTELKRLRKTDPQSDEELDRIQKRIKLLREEKKALLGNAKTKHEVGTYRDDSIEEVTAPIDSVHQVRSLEINKAKGGMGEIAYNIAKAEEMIRYCEELNAALAELRRDTDKTHTQTLDKITAKENETADNLLAAQQSLDKNRFQLEKKGHSDRLAAIQTFYDTQQRYMDKAVRSQIRSEKAAELYRLKTRRDMRTDELAELKRFRDKVTENFNLQAAEKQKQLDELDKQIKKKQSELLNATGDLQDSLTKLSKAPAGSITEINENHSERIKEITETYDTAIAMAEKGGIDIAALAKRKNQEIATEDFNYRTAEWDRISEFRDLSLKEQYDRDLKALRNALTNERMTQTEFEKSKLALKMKYAKRYFNNYANLSGTMFSALQDAEIARSDAKYDILIQQAKNNGEDTTALEEEKENKKLEIQKKYADVNFAFKVSSIIADTAAAVIKTFAEFGYTPWGIAAAAMMSATGAAQVAVAKAERDKIKNMQPGNTAGSSAASSPAKAERVLTGYAEGGYTGDGPRYEVAGLVHRGEYVVPKPIMDNPRVIDAVGVIEAIRRDRLPAPAHRRSDIPAQYADGGYTGAPSTAATAELVAAAKELRAAAKNIRAYVVYKDIKRAEEDTLRAETPFTRNR